MQRIMVGVWVAFSLTFSSNSFANTQRVFTGQAFSMETGQLLYTEEHVLTGACQGATWVTSAQHVSYRQPDGKLMAEKVIAFAGDYAIESLRFEDYRFSRSIELSAVTTSNGVPVVVDAAFNLYVHSHWSSLLAGDELNFPFRAVDFEEVIRMRLSLVDTAVGDDGQSRYIFRLAPDSWLTRVFVSPVRLTYDAQGELRRYEGITNLVDKDDRYFRARIDYGVMSTGGSLAC